MWILENYLKNEILKIGILEKYLKIEVLKILNLEIEILENYLKIKFKCGNFGKLNFDKKKMKN